MIRLLRAFFAFRRVYPSREIPDFTSADAKGLEVFLRSATGRKLLAHLDRNSGDLNRYAVESRGDAFEAGAAFGAGAVVTWLFRLSAQSEDSPAFNEDTADSLDHLNP